LGLSFSLLGFAAICKLKPVTVMFFSNLMPAAKIVVEHAYIYNISCYLTNFLNKYTKLENSTAAAPPPIFLDWRRAAADQN